ncbi:helix-turn-helix transcriptional regulator [Williamsia soli]|uniref:helix-turn-helix transcriptional regulator n=1 Tax=Williamsia soli TaxID=364929 RepID=UPI001A9FA363|nr:LuxR family transcriptional regulator [Williamsia soli]
MPRARLDSSITDSTTRPSAPHALAGSTAERYRLPLRGRAAEAQVIAQGINAAISGNRAITVFSGDPGIGKTRLLQHAYEKATSLNCHAMIVAPDIDSSMTPLGALVNAATRNEMPLVARSDLEAALRAPTAPHYWATRVIADALEAAASESGAVVIVDDLQWLDAGSLATITALINDLQGVPVYWLMATRTGRYGVAHQRFIAQFVDDSSSYVGVEPLDAEAVWAMTSDALGSAPGPRVQSAVERAEGLPLVVLELLRGLEEDGLLVPVRGGVDLESDALPARFGSSASERLHQLSPEALRFAQIGSLYGREFPIGGVLDALGQTAITAAPAVQELLDLGFIIDSGTSLAFRHDTVQSAAWNSLSPTLRRAMTREIIHKRLAEGEDIAALAALVASVADSADDDSIELLLDAARQLSITDIKGAADLIIEGARLAIGRTIHADHIARLLPVVLSAGRIQEAVAISDALAPVLGPDSRAVVHLAIARQLTESDFDGAIAETTLALATAGISESTKVQILAVRALNYANKADAAGLRDSLQQARAIADVDRDTLALATIDATESVLLFNQDQFRAADRLQRQAIEQITRAGSIAGLWLPEGLWMAFMRNSLGYYAEAIKLIEKGLAEANAANNVIAETYWRMVYTRALYDYGRLEDARTQAETVLELATQLGLGDFTNATAGIVLHRIALHTGDVELRETVLPRVHQLAKGVGLRRTGNWHLALEAFDQGRAGAARDYADTALCSLREPIPSMTTPADFADDLMLSLICRQVDDLAGLDLVVDVAHKRATRNPDNNLVVAVATATQGVRDASAATLLEAAEQLQHVNRPLVMARVLETAGTIDPTAETATTSLDHALRLYDELGAARDATRVLQTLRSRGVSKRLKAADADTDGLSTREHQVAERIAAGLTTQQIAEDLMVSPHTVVTHIRHIYTKWGLNTRRDVADRFRRRSL